ncbi:Hydrolase, alpha/beta fold family [Fulvivirga imtechensis AK7]|uniref:Hydrolase, alpha/beta fold family n=1 Tax=Fulvivirga imtechensis AK7 TaxID=1237149 RepID=L8JHI4_9BACT|nr:alpha/beta fold hydrolase [Fulvivirga imtechensis]ELR68255.1 Hydrolase, alpha/beta fold family [Fulvivirga imtechensis AK7]
MNYEPPLAYFSSHIETIFPALFRKVKDIKYQRERIDTPDDDFLDLDWLRKDSKKLVIISHGLEGNSTRPYIKGMARAFFRYGYDVLAWNFRGCSDEINKQLRFYHSGATDDLNLVVDHASQKGYKDICLIGFSLGGNLTLKYVGEQGPEIKNTISKAVAFSVPLDLYSSCIKISESSNFIYSRRFLNNLKAKVLLKAQTMPGKLGTGALSKIKTIQDFDDHYTAPLHGFKNALDYYNACSSINFLKNISIPTLIVNAKNDPFLSQQCYPHEMLKGHPCITFEAPERGGHVGFTEFNKEGLYWSEKRALSFAEGKLPG